MFNDVEAHAHCKVYHPDKFAGVITPIINKNNVAFIKGLQKVNPFSDNDIFDRLATFLTYEYSTDRQVIEELVKQNPNKYICVKIMDLSCMGAGNVKVTLLEQLSTLLLLKIEYPQLILFPVIDPRNKDLDEIYKTMRKCIGKLGGFGFYPNIGYTLLDKRLDKFFGLLNDNKKACIIHTTDTTPVYYKGNDLRKLLQPLKKYFFYKEYRNNKKACGNFCHPHFVVERAKIYTDTNFVFAHFGGDNMTFRGYILKIIQSFENCYADDSSTFEENTVDLIKYRNDPKICKKILGGSDWYMNSLAKKSEQLTIINKEFAYNSLKCFRLI